MISIKPHAQIVASQAKFMHFSCPFCGHHTNTERSIIKHCTSCDDAYCEDPEYDEEVIDWTNRCATVKV